MPQTAAIPARVVILSAPSGGGKSSLARALVESCDTVVASVSHTTRPRREGETDGVDYFFVDDRVFEHMIEAGDFLEYARVFGHCYGTSRTAVDQFLARGKSVVLDIDWQGAQEVRRSVADVVSVYILPPSAEALAGRLVSRGRDSAKEIRERMAEAASEMSHHVEYDHIMVNADFATALVELRALVLNGVAPVSACGFNIEALVHCAKNVRLKTSDAASL